MSGHTPMSLGRVKQNLHSFKFKALTFYFFKKKLVAGNCVWNLSDRLYLGFNLFHQKVLPGPFYDIPFQLENKWTRFISHFLRWSFDDQIEQTGIEVSNQSVSFEKKYFFNLKFEFQKKRKYNYNNVTNVQCKFIEMVWPILLLRWCP